MTQSSKAKSHDNEGPALENNADEQEVLIMRQIVKNFSCAEHPKKACYVTTNGPHYAFTAGDLSIWAGLVVSVPLVDYQHHYMSVSSVNMKQSSKHLPK